TCCSTHAVRGPRSTRPAAMSRSSRDSHPRSTGSKRSTARGRCHCSRRSRTYSRTREGASRRPLEQQLPGALFVLREDVPRDVGLLVLLVGVPLDVGLLVLFVDVALDLGLFVLLGRVAQRKSPFAAARE